MVYRMGAERARPRTVLAVGVLAVLYAIAAKFGLSLHPVSGFATLVWPPTGLALSALLIFGFRLWPGVFLGAWLANVWVGATGAVAFAIASGNALEAVLGAYVMRKLMGTKGTFDSLRDVLGIILGAATASTLVSATIGVGSLGLGGIVHSTRQAGETWRAWWVGDALGDLVVAPLLLTWVRRSERLRLKPTRALEASVVITLLGFTACVVFFRAPAPAYPFASSYILFPLVVWAALRFQLRGATVATALTSVLSIWGTVRGTGPFAFGTLAQSFLALQAFMGCVAVTGLVVAGVTIDRARAIRTQETLMATVSHDLKNPLNALMMSGQALLRKLPNESVRAHNQLMRRTIDGMMRLISDLLDASAIERGRLALELRPESSRVLVVEALEMLRPLAAAKHVTLDSRGLQNVEVMCDRDRTLQVLSNVIGNAIKFCPVESTITVKAERAGHAAHFSFRDQGPGIPAGELPRLFERFRHARSSAGGGTGMGLFIAKGIVEAQGGRIWAESKLGAGSTFHFTLPVLAHARRALVRDTPVPPLRP
jgi:signal transduction histidine kinase